MPRLSHTLASSDLSADDSSDMIVSLLSMLLCADEDDRVGWDADEEDAAAAATSPLSLPFDREACLEEVLDEAAGEMVAAAGEDRELPFFSYTRSISARLGLILSSALAPMSIASMLRRVSSDEPEWLLSVLFAEAILVNGGLAVESDIGCVGGGRRFRLLLVGLVPLVSSRNLPMGDGTTGEDEPVLATRSPLVFWGEPFFVRPRPSTNVGLAPCSELKSPAHFTLALCWGVGLVDQPDGPGELAPLAFSADFSGEECGEEFPRESATSPPDDVLLMGPSGERDLLKLLGGKDSALGSEYVRLKKLP